MAKLAVYQWSSCGGIPTQDTAGIPILSQYLAKDGQGEGIQVVNGLPTRESSAGVRFFCLYFPDLWPIY